MKNCKHKKHGFVNAYTIELAIQAMTYVSEEKIQKRVRPVFTLNAKF